MRDPASSLINKFAILMACVILASAGASVFLAWALWRLALVVWG